MHIKKECLYRIQSPFEGWYLSGFCAGTSIVIYLQRQDGVISLFILTVAFVISAMNSDGIVNKELLKKVTGEFDLASIIKLNARNLGILELGVIGECSGIMYLDLSENRIADLHPLELLKSLITLDISCNRITSLVGLEGLESLRSINIAGNLITSIDSLLPLTKLEFLENLRLQDKVKNLSNPVCQTLSQYKSSICKFLVNLSMLDGEKISGEGAQVFEMCDSMERKLNELERDEKPSGGHVYRDLKDLDLPEKQAVTSPKMEKKVAWSAEQQFKDLLEQCRNLNDEADRTIDDAKKALWGTSKKGIS